MTTNFGEGTRVTVNSLRRFTGETGEVRGVYPLKKYPVEVSLDSGVLTNFHRSELTVSDVPNPLIDEMAEHLKAKKEQEDTFAHDVTEKTNAIRDLLIEKNKKYGDSALSPIHIFSPWDSVNALKVRIDDKLSRIKRGGKDDEDTVTDLIGYLVMFQIAKDRAAKDRDG